MALGLNSRHLAYVIYTSGSTGIPKGVANTVEGLRNRLLWFGSSVATEVPITALKTSIGFVDSVTETLETLVMGGTLVVFDAKTVRDPVLFVKQIEKLCVSNLVLVPSLLRNLMEFSPAGLSSLRTLVCSGERLPGELIERVKAAYPKLRLFNCYGSSEANGDSTALLCSETDAASSRNRSIIGRPIANTQIYILDERLEPVPMGVTGELYIGGAGVARGYLNQPELTAERFLADPFSREAGGRMYKTGDLGRWLADGNIEYLGRNDFQVKIRGFRVDLGQIEARLMECEGVREAVVVTRKDEIGEKRLVAYVAAQEGMELSVAELRSQLSARLPEYTMPSAFVSLEAMPLTANGELDRASLPAPTAIRNDVPHIAPRNLTAMVLATIWTRVLEVDPIGINDNFFVLGGHSLLAVKLLQMVNRQFNKTLPLAALFTSPTIAALATIIDTPQSRALFVSTRSEPGE